MTMTTTTTTNSPHEDLLLRATTAIRGGDWASRSSGGLLLHLLARSIDYATSSPKFRTLLAALLLWAVLSPLPPRRKHRQLSALLSGLACAFLTVAYMSPVFCDYGGSGDRGDDGADRAPPPPSPGGGGGGGPAAAALAVLAAGAGLVGAALGSLLPRASGGASLGCASALLAGACLAASSGGAGRPGGGEGWGGFALAGPAAALVGGVATAR